jgi:hypothetical protein
MKFIGWKCNFEQISYILVKFHQNFDTKKMKKKIVESFHLHKNYCFKWIYIDYVPLFDIYELSSEHFVYWHGHMNFPTCQKIGSGIIWGHEMIRFTSQI